MNPLLRPICALLAAGLLTTACERQQPADAAPTVAPSTEPPNGPRLYARNCASCHGATGGGGMASVGPPAPAFVARDAGGRLTADAIINAIRTGPGAMPPNRALSDEEVAAIADHVRRLIDAARPPEPPSTP